MNIILRRKLSRAYAYILNVYDRLSSKEVDLSLGDIMLNHGCIDSLQFLVASRIMDVEEYINNDNDHFEITNTISKAAYPERDDNFFNESNRVFIGIIKSICELGFDKKYPIKIDSEYRITDGTHRIAVCFNQGYTSLSARVLRRKSKNAKNPDPYYAKEKLNSVLLKSIFEKNGIIQDRLIEEGHCYCLHAECGAGVVDDLKALASVKEVLKNNDAVLVKFTLEKPDYFIKNKQLVSKRILDIEEIINRRYPFLHYELSKNCSEGYMIYQKYHSLFK